ncbi:serine/threonine-protein kinase ATG1c-like isoform X2 [Coffea arabica]|uniref:Serine/threonine-protein kinase ATG1c-like isoform X2 n=1 Tax=Coffea arabica TaxID=13443 RepID=A0A6P6SZ32_COFAR|nr:serine/threonine-protein kinase ATG1c-like isoform X2 [Coffea arabica]
MAQPMSRGGRFVVGEYVVGQQVGAGSFSTVWHGRHRVHGTEVAIKEIVTARLNTKLRDSLKSEIVILKKINHPNIIRLHDMIEDSGKIYIILEYCRGGDLSVYIQKRQGGIPEATAKHFMQQLASGLKVLRENNLIHRDLKPQNLLLSTNDDKSILKIADFGFARSLQPRGLAETLCGSPLYMAPEIMQLQKYDAKADLWSVGAILFQLVTGKTPYTGNNQLQLFQNIVRSTELQFPRDIKDLSPHCIDLCRKLLRRNPVERLTFEEFFNHPFLSQRQADELLWNMRRQKSIDGFPLCELNPVGKTEEIAQEDLPFSLDDDSSGPDGSPSFVGMSPIKSTYGFSLDAKADRKEASKAAEKMDFASNYGSVSHKPEATMFNIGGLKLSEGKLKESLKSVDPAPAKSHIKVADSLELIDQEYVLVPGPPLDVSSSPVISTLENVSSKPGSPPQVSGNINLISTAPMPIVGTAANKVGHIESFESHGSAPGTSQESMDVADTLEQPSADCITRVRSLKCCASAIRELVNEKLEAGKQLEAFSVQLVILAIWKQALHICHTRAASAMEGSPTPDSTRLREMTKEQDGLDIHEDLDAADTLGSQHICSQIERAFLLEVGNAEELAKIVEPGNTEMPDAMETIFQSALALGRRGAVDEYMGRTDDAVVFYSKAVRLLVFLLVEAPSLILNPPFSLTDSDRYRLQSYIDVLNNRQSISRSQRMALLKGGDQQCSS